MNEEVLYRFDSHNVSRGVDMFDDPLPDYSIRVALYKYPIVKRTPKGAWIESFSNPSGKRFILLTARKQFASETVDKAKECFIARKKRYIHILSARIEDAENALKQMEIYHDRYSNNRTKTLSTRAASRPTQSHA